MTDSSRWQWAAGCRRWAGKPRLSQKPEGPMKGEFQNRGAVSEPD